MMDGGSAWLQLLLSDEVDGRRDSPDPVTAGEQKLLPVCNRCCGILEAGRGRLEPRMRVLVVEDHKELAATIAVGLRREGMAVDIAFDGEDALRHAAGDSYDVILLDRDLPKIHGDDVCRALVARGSRSRVLMLTAADTIEDRVDGLGLGADDYLPKPFAFAELVARIRALARRSETAHSPLLARGDLRLDTVQRVATRAGRRLELSGKELAVLELLLAAGGAPVPTRELLARGWDEYVDPDGSVVKVTISRLRRKLGDPPVIETVPHAGYRISQ